MNRVALTLVGSLLLVVSSTAATPAEQAFLRLKKLEGTWAGKAEGMDAKVIYKLTGAGSALVETQFPGTPHEMVTIYHLDGNRLMLTHYCAAKNQPSMKLVPGRDPDLLAFDFVSGSNMKPADMHMHSMKHRLVDANHLKSEWTSFVKGKAVGTVHFDLHRAEPSER